MTASGALAAVGSPSAGPGLLVSLAGVLLVALIAGRLLGVRRSLPAMLVAGLAGWVAAVLLSTAIARGLPDPNAGFTRNVWVFAAVFTMSATVFIELLARPGVLARAQTGLSGLPRPIRALRRRGRRVARYAQITRIAVRHGLAPALGLSRAPRVADAEQPAGPARRPTAVRLRLAMEECGGIFVKLGQVLSTRSDLLPAAVCAELAKLQDEVALDPPDAIREVLEAEIGRPVEQVFADFDWTPIAGASIGQAYRARLRTGERVVVKVQRPGIAGSIERDLDVLDQLVRLAEDRTSWAAEYGVRELAAEFAERLRGELDFRAEARNATTIAAALDPAGSVRVPAVYDELSSGRVLVLEWFDGVNVRDAGLPAERRQQLADDLLRSMLAQVLTDGCFHADPHPGNVLLLTDGRLGLIDFGSAGRLDPLQQAALRDLLVAVAQRDPGALRDAVLHVAEPRRDLDEAALERALARFTARQLGPGATPSAQMLVELLRLCFTFGLTLPAEMSTVFRALGTLEGTLRVLAPGYLAIDAAQRIAAEWIRDRAGADALPTLARDELIRLLPVLRRLPSHADRLATQLHRGQLHLRVGLFADERDVVFLTRLTNRVVLAFLGGVVGLLSAVLLTTTGGPAFTGDTSLFQFFGYFGLFCATVLILRVLVAVLRDRLN